MRLSSLFTAALFSIDLLAQTVPCSGPQYQSGSPACEFVWQHDWQYLTGESPLAISLAAGETPPGPLVLSSNIGSAWDLGIGAMPLVRRCNGAPSIGGELVGLNLLDPGFLLAFGGSFAGAFGNAGTVDIPLPAAIPRDFSLQAVALDASSPTGLRLSQPATVTVEIPNLTSLVDVGPAESQATPARRLRLNSGAFPSMPAAGLYGAHSSLWVARNGVVQLGGGTYGGPAGLPAPADLLTGRPKIILGGAWVHAAGTITAQAARPDAILISINGAREAGHPGDRVDASVYLEAGGRVVFSGLLAGVPPPVALIGIGPGAGGQDAGDQRAAWAALAAQGGGTLTYPPGAAVYCLGKPAGVDRIELRRKNGVTVIINGPDAAFGERPYDAIRDLLEDVSALPLSPHSMTVLWSPLKAAELATLANDQTMAQAHVASFAAAAASLAAEIEAVTLDLSFLNEPWVTSGSASFMVRAGFVHSLQPGLLEWLNGLIREGPLNNYLCRRRCMTAFIDCAGDFTDEEAALLYRCTNSEWNSGSGGASDTMWRILDCFDRGFPGRDWNDYGLCIRDLYACFNGCL